MWSENRLELMHRKYLIVGLAIGLALSLTVALGVAWSFMREQNAGPDAVQGTLETEINGARPRGGGGAAAGNNVRAAKFAELETDKDGKLTLAEFGVGRKPAEAAKWFKRRDADHDGFLGREEFLPFSAGPKTQ
jgi:hypothetical protein